MLEIKSTDATEIDDSFEFKYIHIGTIYSLIDDNLNIVDRNSYQDYDCNYYDSLGIFESIVDLGKTFIQTCKINSLKDVKRSVAKHEKNIHKIVTEWLLMNPYPYKCPIVSPDHNDYLYFLDTFVYDCVNCYILYDIHKWLIKICSNESIICVAPKASIELKMLNERLEFINLIERLEEYSNHIPLEYEIELDSEKENRKICASKVDLINRIMILDEITIHDLQDYYTFIWNYIILNYSHSSYNLGYDIQHIPVIGKKTMYEPNINCYRQLDTADTIMEVAYYILDNYLTSRTTVRKRICENPECNNEFNPKTTQHFCKNKKCQDYRNKRKSYNNYHGLTEPQKKASHND